MARKRRRKNSGGGLAYVINPGGMFGKKKRRRKRRRKHVAHKRAHRRRKRNPIANLLGFANPGKKRKRRRRKHRRANPRRHRRHSYRRNPSLSGIVGQVKHKVLSPETLGGALGGALDLFVGDKLLATIPADWKGPAKIGVGLAAAVGMDFVGALRKYSGGVMAYFAGAGVKQTVGRMIGAPAAQLADLADAYGALIAQGGGQGMGALTYPGRQAGMGLLEFSNRPVGVGDFADYGMGDSGGDGYT